MKIHIGDTVLVTIGKDKGRQGKVQKVFPKKDKVVVEGVNIYKRHRKGVGREGGQVVEFTRPLSTAKVAVVCPKCNKQTRITMSVDKNGNKTRICVKCKTPFEVGESK